MTFTLILTWSYVLCQYPNKRVSISTRLFVEETKGMSYKQIIKTRGTAGIQLRERTRTPQVFMLNTFEL